MSTRLFTSLGEGILLLAAYFLTGKMGLSLDPISGFATFVWPPTGIALAALLLWGWRFWPAISLGAFLVNLTSGASVPVAFGIATGNTLEAIAGFFLLTMVARFSNDLKRIRDVLALVLFGALGSTLVSSTIGTTTLFWEGGPHLATYGSTWMAWWMGDMLGNLVVAPPLLVWGTKPWSFASKRVLGEALISFLLLLGVLRFAAIPYLIFPPLIWVAVRFGQRGSALAVLLVSIGSVWATAVGYGPFASGLLSHSLFQLQLFTGVAAVTMLIMAAAVAERLTAVEQHQKYLERFLGIYNSSKDAIRYSDLGGAFEDVNEAFVTLSGYSREELLQGMNFKIMTPEKYHELEDEKLEKLLKTGRPVEYEKEIVRKDGTHIPVLVTTFGVHSPKGRLKGIAAILKDIREQKRLERIKDEFVSTVSHELRTPLTIMELDIANLKKSIPSFTVNLNKILARLSNGARRLAKLIDNLLDLSRLESERTRLNRRPVNIIALIEELIQTMKGTTIKEDCLELHLSDGLPEIYGDPDLITAVLSNLLENANRFAKNRVVLTASSVLDPPDNFPRVEIIVKDDGPGIAKEEQKEIFSKFIQIDRPMGGSGYKGTGLGLAICREIVQKHHGKIWVESRQGDGAEFHFTLPVWKIAKEVNHEQYKDHPDH